MLLDCIDYAPSSTVGFGSISICFNGDAVVFVSVYFFQLYDYLNANK